MAPKDIPIIFSGPMVRALLEGRKTQTRRLAVTSRQLSEESSPGKYHSRTKLLDSPWKQTAKGDRLWVRENFAYVGTCDPGFLTYQATYPGDLAHLGMENVPPTLKEAGYKWTPCIHMPRKLSRLTLVVAGVKVERLNDISDDDAKAEGIAWCSKFEWWHCDPERDGAGPGHGRSPADAFLGLWSMLHGAESVADNPFVVAITFRVIKANIDAPEARAAA